MSIRSAITLVDLTGLTSSGQSAWTEIDIPLPAELAAAELVATNSGGGTCDVAIQQTLDEVTAYDWIVFSLLSGANNELMRILDQSPAGKVRVAYVISGGTWGLKVKLAAGLQN